MTKSKLPQKEVEICGRLRYAREIILEMTQAGCAKQIGLDRSTLANYETSRTPLRYEIALRFCRQFIICEEWLATGRFEACHKAGEAHGISGKNGWDFFDQKIFLRQCVDLLSDPATIHIRPGMLFSEAFATILQPRFAQLVDRFFYAQPLVLSSSDNPELPENLLKAIHQRHIILLDNEALRLKIEPSDLRRLYTRYLFECSVLIFRKLMGGRLNDEAMKELDWLRVVMTDPDAKIGPPYVLVGEHPRGIDPRTATHNTQKQDLTDAESSNISSDVQAQLPELLERLKKATSATGKKTELAGVLKAPLASVSRWLSGEREPGGEIALKMDAWATGQGYPRRPSNKK